MTNSGPPTTRFSVGLTGGIGSGKSTVTDMFAERGAAIVDTDQIAHQLTAPGGAAIAAIQSEFGDSFITPSGAMDRARMRARVFADSEAKKRLEAILHPLIRIESDRAASQVPGSYLIFVVPLLVESGTWKQRLSRVCVVDCPEHLQVKRVMSRSGLNESQVLAIMATQATRQARLSAADDVILNEGSQADLRPQVDRLHALYAALAAKGR
ncbi:dephospho-CoA kinase [Noviherbaspirillum massiliense]|uniref:dephospho-CoA kinase n=1 Tax=Noviherbaspirillum massiliense TaxID=1465823 RepID=UPI00037B9458|nr:dephospho-CoA kinase [Noviherbaspirillum massiliense]